jgi:hypothetical protein
MKMTSFVNRDSPTHILAASGPLLVKNAVGKDVDEERLAGVAFGKLWMRSVNAA